MSTDLNDRFGTLRIEIGEATAARHHAAIAAELRTPSAIPPRRRRRRGRLIAIATAAIIALSAAGALAAESTVPGDLLYPVKQLTEWVRAWVDPTVAVDHRIDELELLIERRATREQIDEQLARTEVAVRDTEADQEVVDRFFTVKDRIDDLTVDDRTDEPRDRLDRPDRPRPRDRDAEPPTDDGAVTTTLPGTGDRRGDG